MHHPYLYLAAGLCAGYGLGFLVAATSLQKPPRYQPELHLHAVVPVDPLPGHIEELVDMTTREFDAIVAETDAEFLRRLNIEGGL